MVCYNGYNQPRKESKMRYMNVKQIAEKAGVKPSRVYYIKDKLGHLPTVAEVKNYKPTRSVGRPQEYKLNEKEGE
jgi:hypothetical protein